MQKSKIRYGIYPYRTSIKRGMKRFVARKRKLRPLKLSNDTMRIKCEFDTYIYTPNGSSNVVFAAGNDYYVITNMQSFSQSWTSFSTLYSRYKIYGLAIEVAPTVGITYNLSLGVPPVCVCFYPNLSGSSAGANPNYNEYSLYVNPQMTGVQKKYWHFPDGYYSNGSTGFGVWSQCSGYASQVGQVSVNETTSSVATGNQFIYNFRACLYILLSDKII